MGFIWNDFVRISRLFYRRGAEVAEFFDCASLRGALATRQSIVSEMDCFAMLAMTYGLVIVI